MILDKEVAIMSKNVLMVIAPEEFRDEELFQPKEILEKQGAQVKIASKTLGTAKGMLGGTATPDLLISEARAVDYDAIVVVGGIGSPEYLWSDETLHTLLRTAEAQDKVIGAICLSGAVLARAGLLKHRRATVYKTADSLKEFEKAGAEYTAEDVVVDDRLITASGPHVAAEFGRAIANQLSS
jgi:protease I